MRSGQDGTDFTSFTLIQSAALPNMGRNSIMLVQAETSHVCRSVVSPDEMADGTAICWRVV